MKPIRYPYMLVYEPPKSPTQPLAIKIATMTGKALLGALVAFSRWLGRLILSTLKGAVSFARLLDIHHCAWRQLTGQKRPAPDTWHRCSCGKWVKH